MKLLFVCTGNICRSPTAEGVMAFHLRRAGLADRVAVDSAGTMAYHEGEEPDPRAQMVAEQRGYDLSDLRARLLEPEDFREFDLLLAMDRGHLRSMKRMRAGPADVRLFLDYANGQRGRDVPDPYYGQKRDFDVALDLIEMGVRGLLDEIAAKLA